MINLTEKQLKYWEIAKRILIGFSIIAVSGLIIFMLFTYHILLLILLWCVGALIVFAICYGLGSSVLDEHDLEKRVTKTVAR